MVPRNPSVKMRERPPSPVAKLSCVVWSTNKLGHQPSSWCYYTWYLSSCKKSGIYAAFALRSQWCSGVHPYIGWVLGAILTSPDVSIATKPFIFVFSKRVASFINQTISNTRTVLENCSARHLRFRMVPKRTCGVTMLTWVDFKFVCMCDVWRYCEKIKKKHEYFLLR